VTTLPEEKKRLTIRQIKEEGDPDRRERTERGQRSLPMRGFQVHHLER